MKEGRVREGEREREMRAGGNILREAWEKGKQQGRNEENCSLKYPVLLSFPPIQC